MDSQTGDMPKPKVAGRRRRPPDCRLGRMRAKAWGARAVGTRGFRVLGCSTPPGRPARVHETWCAVRDRHRCTVTLTAAVRDYDDIVDAVASAIDEWAPPIGEVA